MQVLDRNVRVYRHIPSTSAPVRKRSARISPKLMWRLLLLSAVGSAFSDVLLFRFGGFAVTLPHLLLIVAATFILLGTGCVSSRIALICLAILMLEVCHAAIFGFVMDREWKKSFAQLLLYSMCFVLLTGFRLEGSTIEGITSWSLWLGIIMGGIGILQFGLFSFGISTLLPESWRLSANDPYMSAQRFSGFVPAIGLATEQSLYAIGLITLLACVLFLDNAGLVFNRRVWKVSVFSLLAGILFSLSLTGIIIASALLVVTMLYSKAVRRLLLILSFVAIGIAFSRHNIFQPVHARIERVIQGSDSSSQVRVVAAPRLLFGPTSDAETSLLGTGLGMEMRQYETYERVYQEVAAGALDPASGVKLHNIVTVVKFYQGWLGIALYAVLVWLILRPLTRKFLIYSPLFVMFFLYHFASGYYLVPSFWSVLGLLYILRRGPVPVRNCNYPLYRK